MAAEIHPDLLSRQNAPTVLDVIRVFTQHVHYMTFRCPACQRWIRNRPATRCGHIHRTRNRLTVYLEAANDSVLRGVDLEVNPQQYLYALYFQSVNSIIQNASHFTPGDVPEGNWTIATSVGGGRGVEYRVGDELVTVIEIKPSSAAGDRMILCDMPEAAPDAFVSKNAHQQPIGVKIGEAPHTLVGGHLFHLWTQLASREIQYSTFTNGNAWLPLRVMDRVNVLDTGLTCADQAGPFDPLKTPFGYLLALSLLPAGHYSRPLPPPIPVPPARVTPAAAPGLHTDPAIDSVSSSTYDSVYEPPTSGVRSDLDQRGAYAVLDSEPIPRSRPCSRRANSHFFNPSPSTSHSSPSKSSSNLPGEGQNLLRQSFPRSITIELVDEVLGPHSLDMIDITSSAGVVLTKVDNGDLEACVNLVTPSTLAPAPISVSDTTATMAISRGLGRGGTSDVYAATLAAAPIAAKLSLPFSEAMRQNADSTTMLSASHIAELEVPVRYHLANEARVLGGPLSALHGEAVPQFFGTYRGMAPASAYSQQWALAPTGPLELWATLVQRTEPTNVETMTHVDKLEVVARYRQIHDAGVIHGDVAPRHWRRSAAGRMLIIDFGHATMREDLHEADFEGCVAGEMMEVRRMLGLGETT